MRTPVIYAARRARRSIRPAGLCCAALLGALALGASSRAARAQPSEPPPGEPPPGQPEGAGTGTEAPPRRTPTDELSVPAPPAEGQPPPGPLPSATPPGQVPRALVVGPLVDAAEADLSAGRAALALARATLAVGSLSPGEPLRVRAEGLQLLAQQRRSDTEPDPGVEEVVSPLVAQAELDFRSGNGALGLPRLDLALQYLPPGSGLRQRAMRLRQSASAGPGYGSPGAVPAYAPQRAYVPPPRPPADPERRGTAEAVELFVTAGLFGALTGGWVPFVASDGTAASPVYTLTVVGGAGLFFVGALALDLTTEPRSGVEPTISAALRFGAASGFFAFLMYDELDSRCPPAPAPCTSADPNVSFSLAWAGAATGAALGVAVGFGLEPEVRHARFVESTGIWGVALAGSAAMLTDFEDQAVVGALGLAGLNAGWLIGALTLAGGAEIGIGRTLFMDLGFIGGWGVGLLAPLLGYYVAQETPEPIALGLGSLIGSIAGWATMLGLTDGWNTQDGSRTAPADEPTVHLGISPVEGGAVLGVSGTL